MHPVTPNDHAAAADVFASLEDSTQRGVLELLIAHPGERFDTAAVADRLGLDDHREVAQATYAIGEALRVRGLARPWTEAQMGYAMPAETAILFQGFSRAKGG